VAGVDPDVVLRTKIEAATIAIPDASGLPEARFVLIVKAEQDPLEVAAAAELALAPLKARVERLSNLDHRALLLIIPGRTFKGDPAPAFEAGYELVRRFSLEAAEPEVFSDVFPEPDLRRKGPAAEAIDDFPPGCWAPEQPELDKRWAIEQIFAPAAWAASEALQRPSRGAGIVIAQPDTGIASHPELAGIMQAAGHDFVDDNSDPTDPLNYPGNPGHGTGTASVVVSPEADEVAGTAPKATHMSIRAIESVIRLSQVNVAKAIDFAVEHGAHVITMSLGGIPSFSLHRALTRAVQSDVIVLAAAGNCVGLVVWPARYDACVAVAGTNNTDQPWRGSSSGADVDIAAPGENVFRAQVEPGKPPSVGQGQGTSFAVALTAGVAACWLAHHGRANVIAAARARGETVQTMFLRLLKATARRPASWDSFNMGAGVVHAQRLLQADFDLGREQETTAGVPIAEAPALSVRRFVAESVSVEAAHADLDWNLHGPEIALSVLNLRLGRAPSARGGPRPEAAPGAFVPNLSPTLAAAVAADAALAAALAPPAKDEHG